MKFNNFDELVFEFRNKEYGAYILRRKYNKTIIISLIICIFISITIVTVPFLAYQSRTTQMGSRLGQRYIQLTMDKIEPPKEESFSIMDISPPKPLPTTTQYIAPQIVDSVPDLADLPITETEQLEKNISDENELTNSISGDNMILGIGENGLLGDKALLESEPSFKGGGTSKFRDWIGRNTIYPKQAQNDGIYGTVSVTFVIEKDGSVSNVKIVKGVDQLIDNETIRVISSSPKWRPGTVMGKPVRVRCSILLNFRPS